MKYCLPCVSFLLLLMISACSKYEEGPAFSLRSKKSRMVNDWKLVSSDTNGQTYMNPTLYLLKPKKDEKFDMNIKYGDQIFSVKGTWEFSNDKERLFLTYENDNNFFYKIIKLTKDEFWGQYWYIDANNDYIEVLDKFETR